MDNKIYSSTELAEALQKDDFKQPTYLLGLVKQSEKEGYACFSRKGCEHFVDIPLTMIDTAQQVGWSTCGDHGHPIMKLRLKSPATSEGKILLNLLADGPSSYFASTQRLSPCESPSTKEPYPPHFPLAMLRSILMNNPRASGYCPASICTPDGCLSCFINQYGTCECWYS